jgi:hypothetical protein
MQQAARPTSGALRLQPLLKLRDALQQPLLHVAGYLQLSLHFTGRRRLGAGHASSPECRISSFVNGKSP